MRIENYEIEPYEYGYMVSEIVVSTKGDKIGTEYKTNTKYPKDLQRALMMVRDNLQRKTLKTTVQEAIEEFNRIDERFLLALKEQI